MKTRKWILLIMGLLIAISSCKKDKSIQHLSLTQQPDSSTGKDAVFGLIVPNNNYAKLPDIHLYAWTQGGILNVNRVAISFDLSSIPSEAKIDSAFLSLYFNKTSAYGAQHSGDNDFFIQRITSTWNEKTVAWKNQPSSTEQNQVSISRSTLGTQDFPNINVTDLVQDMIKDKVNSFGFLLKLQVEVPYKMLLFASSNNQDPTLRPKFVVYYTVN